MTRRRCCCVRPCAIIADDFNRANSTKLGPKWVEIGGDSEIISQELSMPPGAVVRTVKRHPIDTPSGIVDLNLTNLAIGDKVRSLINFVKAVPEDDRNYVFGELEVTGSSTGVLRFGVRSGGSDTILDSANVGFAGGIGPGTTDNIGVCRSLEGGYAGALASTLAWECIGDNGGRYAGIANAGSTTITVDNFAFSEHYITNPTAGCAACQCECDGHCLPRTLTLTIVSSGCCEPWNGTTVTLTYDPVHKPDFIWLGSVTLDTDFDSCGSEVPGEITFDFILKCNGCVAGEWKLCIEGNSTVGFCNWDLGTNLCFGGGGVASRCLETVDCSPFILQSTDVTCMFSPPPVVPDCVFSFMITE